MFLLQREFKTLYSLKKNTTQHHDDIDDDGIVPVFKDSTGNEVEMPQARNAPIKSKVQHPPPATPRAFELLKIGLFKFPPLGAKRSFKSPTN